MQDIEIYLDPDSNKSTVKKKYDSQVYWHTPVNPAPQEAEAGGHQVQGQPGQLVKESVSQCNKKG